MSRPLVLAVSVTLLVAGSALGVALRGDGRRAALEHEAQRLLALPYWAFGREAAQRRQPFDWSADGCSHTPRVLAIRFSGPCRQHDFAYRNLGRGLRLMPTHAARKNADARFLDELRRRCAELFRGWLRLRCRIDARAMWIAVRRLGRGWGEAGPSSPSRAPDAGRCEAGAQTPHAASAHA